MNRREFMIESGALLLTSALLPLRGIAQSATRPQHAPSYGDEMPDMLVSHLSKGLNDLAFTWNKKRALIHTAEEVEARNVFVRKKVIEMLGGFPEKTPLGAVTVKVMQRDGYRVENVMFQSRPDFWVTGNLYVPTTGNGSFPGIVSPCGHYSLARMLPQYQSAYISLVKSGFVVMAFDPIGEGERRHYWNPETGVSLVPYPTYEHSMPGQLQLLLGENLTEYRVWDAMRAIDYLLTRSEVDRKKIGCAGHSGGGDITDVVSVVDPRIRCVVTLEGGMVDRWPRTYARWQPIGPSDVEQNIFPEAIYGIDEVDMHTAMAPRPVLTGIEHYSPAFDKAAQRVQTRYRQLGASEKFATVAANDPHGWTPKLRMAAADWFCRWFYDRKGPQTEHIYTTEPPENLYCTPDGSIRYSRKGQTIFSLILKKQAHLPPTRPVPKTSAQRHSYQEKIGAEIRNLLHYRKSDHPLGIRHIITTPREGYHIDKIQFLSEPGIYIPAWVYVPEKKAGAPDKPGVLPTILYVDDKGIAPEGMEFTGEEGSGLGHGVLDTLVRKRNLVVAVDVRGIGETRPPHPAFNSCSEFRQLFDRETAMSYMAWFMDRSLLGMRVQDVVRSVDYVASRPDAGMKHLHVIGKGMGGMWCLYAAALDPRIRGLISVQSLLSYCSLTQSDRYLYGADVFVRNVLLHFDLPQVAAAIAGRPLTLIQPKDAMKRTVGAGEAEEAYQPARAAYEAAGLGKLFRIESPGKGLDTPKHYLDLIRAGNATS